MLLYVFAHNDADTERIAMHYSFGYLVWTRINSVTYYNGITSSLPLEACFLTCIWRAIMTFEKYFWKNMSTVVRVCVFK